MKANASEIGLSNNELKGKPVSKPVEKDDQAASQSRIARLKNLLAKVKARGTKKDTSVGQNVPDTELEKPKTDAIAEQPKKDLAENEQVQTEVQESQQNPEETPKPEPLREETVREICDVMVKIPRLDEHYYGHEIPYIVERRQISDGVFDEETGLYVQADYRPNADEDFTHRAGKSGSGLTIILSTPRFTDKESLHVSMARMGEALRKIYDTTSAKKVDALKTYTASELLDVNLRVWENKIGNEGGTDNQVKFVLNYSRGSDGNWVIKSGYSDVSSSDLPSKSADLTVTETGAQFIKGIIERTAQKQIDAADENSKQIDQLLDRVKDEAVPNDKPEVYQYAYHSTFIDNLPSISREGLKLSDAKSKEPGTIFFTGWDTRDIALPDRGVLFRFKVKDVTDIAEQWYFDKKKGFHELSTATNFPVGAEHLDFSLDNGETWMSLVPKSTEKAA